jgi:hypothetical protein
MSLLGLVQRERAARSAAAGFSATAVIWVGPPSEIAAADADTVLAAARAAGRIGPKTEVITVSWLPAESADGDVPTKPAEQAVGNFAARIAALTKPRSDN